MSPAAEALPLFAALVAVALSAGAVVAAAFFPLLPLLLELHAVMDTAIENAAVRTISFFNSIDLTPPNLCILLCTYDVVPDLAQTISGVSKNMYGFICSPSIIRFGKFQKALHSSIS
ncbi:hypothetical protein D3C73_659430 [compost metagenome]